jgi:hypothetical protein
MEKNKDERPTMSSEPSNASAQGVDKDPKTEKGKQDEVSNYDLKAKKIDADPEEEGSKPDAIKR